MTMAIDANAHRLNGRVGGFTTRSRHDPRDYTAAARARFRDGFAERVDPEGVLPPEERQARADAARRAHMARLAAKSASVRSARSRRRKVDDGH
jgi:hypothetical protein